MLITGEIYVLQSSNRWGDKQYVEGDMRKVGNKKDAEQLVKIGLIAEEGVENYEPEASQGRTKDCPQQDGKSPKTNPKIKHDCHRPAF